MVLVGRSDLLRNLKSTLTAKLAFAGLTALTLGGCTGGGSDVTTFDLSKGWLDPTAVGRYQKQPLTVPILTSLDKSIDVGDDQFANATDVRAEDLDPAADDYAIGRNDLLNISITDLVAPNVETVRSTRVSESGFVSLPLVGQVKAAGLTEAELEQAVSKSYKDANLIESAQVSVSVMEARGRSFSILGAVAAPGQYAILNSDFRLFDALVLARDVTSAQGVEYVYVIRQNRKGATTQPAKPANPAAKPEPGSTDDVLTPRSSVMPSQPKMLQTAGATEGEDRYITVDGKQVKVSADGKMETPAAAPATQVVVEDVAAGAKFEFREPAVDGNTRVIRIPYEKLRAGDLRYNIAIKPYDLIFVSQPTIGEFYMGGHVARVGVYSLSARKITLKQAVIAAGMFDAMAIPSRTDLVRRLSNDTEVFVSVDLDKIFDGSQSDIYLKPNDVVTVGTNWSAPFLAAVRGAFRLTYGFGFLYDRNFGDPDDPDFIR
jgi:polysaccharide export outer membrane protein